MLPPPYSASVSHRSAQAHVRAGKMARDHSVLRRRSSSPIHIRRTAICLSLLTVPFVLQPSHVEGRPLFVAHLESGVVTLTDEACSLRAVTNAPKRVTWLGRDGKLTEGCYGRYTARLPSEEVHFIVGYFDDLTLQGLPLSLFTTLYPI